MNVVIEDTATYWMQALAERDEARRERDALKAELAEIRARSCRSCPHWTYPIDYYDLASGVCSLNDDETSGTHYCAYWRTRDAKV